MKLCRIFLIVILLFFFAGCDCGKQLHRLSYRCPQLFETKTVSTVVTIPERNLDTVFVFSKGPADTVFVEIPVEMTKPVIEVKEKIGAMDGFKSLMSWLIALMALMGVFLVIVTVIIKQIKK